MSPPDPGFLSSLAKVGVPNKSSSPETSSSTVTLSMSFSNLYSLIVNLFISSLGMIISKISFSLISPNVLMKELRESAPSSFTISLVFTIFFSEEVVVHFIELLMK